MAWEKGTREDGLLADQADELVVEVDILELAEENDVHHGAEQAIGVVYAVLERLLEMQPHFEQPAEEALLRLDVDFREELASLRGKDPLDHLEHQDHALAALQLWLVPYHCLVLRHAVLYELEEDVMVGSPARLEAVFHNEEVGGLELVAKEQAVVLQRAIEEVAEVVLILLQDGSVGQQAVLEQEGHLVDDEVGGEHRLLIRNGVRLELPQHARQQDLLAHRPHFLEPVVELGPGWVGAVDELGQVLLHDDVEDVCDEGDALVAGFKLVLRLCLAAEEGDALEVAETDVEDVLGEAGEVLDVGGVGRGLAHLFALLLLACVEAVADHLRAVALEVSDDLVHPPGLLLAHAAVVAKAKRFILHPHLLLHPALLVPLGQQPLPDGVLVLVDLPGADVVPELEAHLGDLHLSKFEL